MNVNDVVSLLGLQVLAAAPDAQRPVTGGYACDLLSCVMAKARAGDIWITVQGHPNVIAVASLLDLAGVIVSEGSPVEPATIQKAVEAGIALFAAPQTTYAIATRLALAGLVDAGA